MTSNSSSSIQALNERLGGDAAAPPALARSGDGRSRTVLLSLLAFAAGAALAGTVCTLRSRKDPDDEDPLFTPF